MPAASVASASPRGAKKITAEWGLSILCAEAMGIMDVSSRSLL
jgi:hypothetical protein